MFKGLFDIFGSLNPVNLLGTLGAIQLDILLKNGLLSIKDLVVGFVQTVFASVANFGGYVFLQTAPIREMFANLFSTIDQFTRMFHKP